MVQVSGNMDRRDPAWTPRRCVRCGEVFNADPAQTVECPFPGCKAPAGEPCRGVDGHAFQGTASHPARETLAATSHGHCSGVMKDES